MKNLTLEIQNPMIRACWRAIAASVCLLAFAAGAQDAPPAAAAETPEAPKTALPTLVVPQSVFLSEDKEVENKTTVDPFFPKSVRRAPTPKGPTPEELAEIERKKKEAEAAAAAAAEAKRLAELKPDAFDDLELKGVIGGRRPMATIFTRHKNYLFAPGEWRMVKVPNVNTGELREVRLECVSIKGDVVTIKLEDKPEERILGMPSEDEDEEADDTN